MNKLTSEGSCVLNLWQAMIPRSSPKVNPAMYEFQGAEYWTCYLAIMLSLTIITIIWHRNAAMSLQGRINSADKEKRARADEKVYS